MYMAGRSFGLPLALIWVIRKFGLYLHPASRGEAEPLYCYRVPDTRGEIVFSNEVHSLCVTAASGIAQILASALAFID